MGMMSESEFVCNHCGEKFRTDDFNNFRSKYGYHTVACYKCQKFWCSMECAKKDGFEVYDGEPSCNYCRGNDFEDSELLEFMTAAIGVSRDDLVHFYKDYKADLKNHKALKLDGYITTSFSNKEDNIKTFSSLGHFPNREIGDIHE